MADRHLKFDISVDAKTATKNVDKFNSSLKKTETTADKSSKSIINMKSAITALFSALAVRKLTSFINETIRLAGVQEAANVKLKQATINAGKYSDAFYKASLQLANSLQGITGFSNDAIQNAQAILVSFSEISTKAMPDAIKATLDWARFTGKSVESAARDIGKASTGMVDMLRRYGVQLTKAEVEAKGFGAVMKSIFQIAGGQATAFGRTTAGQLLIVSQAWDDSKKSMGRFFQIVAIKSGLLVRFSNAIEYLTVKFDELNKTGTGEELGKSFKKTLDSIAESLKKLSSYFDPISKGIKLLIYLFKAFVIVGTVLLLGKLIILFGTFALKIDVLARAFLLLVIKCGWLKATLYTLTGVIKIVYNWFTKLNFIQKVVAVAIALMVGDWDVLKNTVRSVTDGFKSLVVEIKFAIDYLKAFSKIKIDFTGIIPKIDFTEFEKAVEKAKKIRTEALREIYTTPLPAVLPFLKDEEKGKVIKFTPIDWDEFDRNLKIADEKLLDEKMRVLQESLDMESKYFELQTENQLKLLDNASKNYDMSKAKDLNTLNDYYNKQKELINKNYDLQEKLIWLNTEDLYEASLKIQGLEIDKNQKLKELLLERLAFEKKLNEEFVDEIEKIWQDLNDNLADSGANAFRRMLESDKATWRSFLDDLSDMFNEFATDLIRAEIFQPIINQITAGLRGKLVPADFVGPLAPGQQRAPKFMGQYGPQIMGGLGAGMAGFGAGRAMGQTGIGAGIGAAVGLGAGPLGAVAGALVGTATEQVVGMIFGLKFKKKRYIEERIDFLFKTIGDSVEYVGEKWVRSEKEREIIDAIEKTFSNQLEFYNKIMGYTVELFPDMRITFTALASKITELVKGAESAFLLTTSGFEQFAEMFPKFTEKYIELFEKTFKPILRHREVYGAGGPADIAPEILTALNEAISVQARKVMPNLMETLLGFTPEQLSDVMESAYILVKNETGRQVKLFFSEMVGTEEWDVFFAEFQERFEEIAQTFSNIIGSAFLATIDTGDYKNFISTVGLNFRESIKQSLSQAFSKQILDEIFAKTGLFGTTGILAQYIGGEIGPEEITTSLTNSLNELNDLLPTLEPIWKEVGDILKQVDKTLGINIGAIEDNTSAIRGPVESFLNELTFGQLAPSISMAQITAQSEKLFSLAVANSENFSDFAQWMTGTGLPFLKGTTTNYRDLVEGLKTRVSEIPWFLEAKEPITPQDNAELIGESVAKRLLPVLENISEGESIVVVDSEGKIVKTVFRALKNDSNIRQEVGAIAKAA